MLYRFLIFFAACWIAAGSLWADEAKEKRQTIRVSAEATVTATPDHARIQIGVVTQAQTAKTAGERNAEKQERVIKAVRKELGSSAEIKTTNYTLTPNYVYPKDGGTPKVTGYTASNTVEVVTGDLSKVGPVIDEAIDAGANNIEALHFFVKNEQPVTANALKQAATSARAKAEVLASALGLRVVRILQVEEGGPTPIPVQTKMFRAEAMEAAPTPIEPGTVEVRATVTLTVQVE